MGNPGYSMFGAQGGVLDASDGFEEWAVRGVVPEPTSLLVLSTGLISMIGLGMKRRRQKIEGCSKSLT